MPPCTSGKGLLLDVQTFGLQSQFQARAIFNALGCSSVLCYATSCTVRRHLQVTTLRTVGPFFGAFHTVDFEKLP